MERKNIDQPVLVSHRGIRKKYPENSLGAFKDAASLGFFHLETDLRATKDGYIVLHHDPYLDLGGEKLVAIAQVSQAQLSLLELAREAKLLSFLDFAHHFKAFNWTLDIKPENARVVAQSLFRLCQEIPWLQEKLLSECRFLFWSAKDEVFFQKTFGPIRCYARRSQCMLAGAFALLGLTYFLDRLCKDRIYSLPESFFKLNCFSRRLVEAFHGCQLKVLAFLPKDEQSFRKAVLVGFDEILCDDRF